MNTQKYLSLLAQPQQISKEDLADLEQVITQYPYFQNARALQLKGLKSQHSFLYNDALKKTAAYTTDRDVLFDYITSEVFTQNEISEQLLQNAEAIKAMEVVSENISEQIALEIDRQLKAELKKAEAILDPTLFEKKTQKNEQEEAKKVLKLDEPLSFTKSETHSFAEWLKLTQAKPIDRTQEFQKSTSEEENDKERKFQLIEKFIQQPPKWDPKGVSETTGNLAKPFTKTSESLMTETLAKVYLQQKNYKKAIQAYKILILKNPEKSGFFADQIRAIQKLIKEQP
ncbi:MAG: hypothetical protein R2793_01805 [Flavobacteriaceae bacterium]